MSKALWSLHAAWDDPVIGEGPDTPRQWCGGDLDGITAHLDHNASLGDQRWSAITDDAPVFLYEARGETALVHAARANPAQRRRA